MLQINTPQELINLTPEAMQLWTAMDGNWAMRTINEFESLTGETVDNPNAYSHVYHCGHVYVVITDLETLECEGTVDRSMYTGQRWEVALLMAQHMVNYLSLEEAMDGLRVAAEALEKLIINQSPVDLAIEAAVSIHAWVEFYADLKPSPEHTVPMEFSHLRKYVDKNGWSHLGIASYIVDASKAFAQAHVETDWASFEYEETIHAFCTQWFISGTYRV